MEVEDCSSVNLCGIAFGLYVMRLRCLWVPDPWHLAWNCSINACKASGMWGSVLLSTTCCNLAYGPWGGEKWWCALQEAAEEHLSLASNTDPLVNRFKDRIQVERGDADGTVDVLQALQGAGFLRKKYPAVATSRWWSWMQCMAKWFGHGHIEDSTREAEDFSAGTEVVQAEWTLRLLPLCHIGVKLGYLSRSARGGFVLDAFRAQEVSSGGTKADKKANANLRNRCKNTLHLATAPWWAQV